MSRGDRRLLCVSVCALACALPFLLKSGIRAVAWADLSPFSRSEGAQLVFSQRLPRVVLAGLVGAALSSAGALMQALTRNPLAGPSLMGLGPGAALGMLLAILYAQPSAAGLAMASFLGATVGAVLVVTVASATPNGATPERTVLAGAVVSGLMTAITGVVVFRLRLIETFWFWTAGGIAAASWRQILIVLPMLSAGALLSVLVARPLMILSIGSDAASALGLRIGRVRALAALAVLLLTGGAVAVAGPVGFVGLIVPNLCRRFTRADLRRLLPLSAAMGALLLILADAISRRAAGAFFDLPLGAVTALFGAPMVIWFARRGLRGL